MSEDLSVFTRHLFATSAARTDDAPAIDAPAPDEAAELRGFARHLFAPTTPEHNPTEGESA